MRGTTVCPHCDTRFKITKAQLEAHHGMVRCGHCLQAFDTSPNFTPDQLDLQLELPILEKLVTADEGKVVVLQPMTLAEQVTFVQDNRDSGFDAKRRSWPWAVAAFMLLLILVAQAGYFFRVDLAAQVPVLKPALLESCRILKCSIPLPHHADLMSIESSGLEADPANENLITLNALLRNRAHYPQSFPDLELTLNDIQDQPLARRKFLPNDYLPHTENAAAGMFADHELNIKLHLDTSRIKPSGYRLMLLYSGS